MAHFCKFIWRGDRVKIYFPLQGCNSGNLWYTQNKTGVTIYEIDTGYTE